MNKKNLNSIIVVSALIDLLILAEIIKAMNEQKRLCVTGKTIVPMDNSWATSVETGCKARVYGKKFICLTEPYVKKQKGIFGDTEYSHEMVKVRSVETGREYEVMFAEEWLVSED